ncbi:MAG: ArsA family ATPase [Actinomycetota bacterium]|nr:ArsA family ATPase [Actinomycetota bacterium]
MDENYRNSQKGEFKVNSEEKITTFFKKVVESKTQTESQHIEEAKGETPIAESSSEVQSKEGKEIILSDNIPSFLRCESLRLVIFGGKGGAGKTTSSTATAMYLAQLHPDKRILVVSSDPAHSLGDSFDCPIDSSVTPVEGVDNLWAIEMDSVILLQKFKKKYKFALENLCNMAYYTDQIDIRDFLGFKLPGMEEMMILLEIVNLLKFGIFRPCEYDLVIWDTAPTGHTLRLLALPNKVLKWIELFNSSFCRYKGVSVGVAALGFNIPGRKAPKGNVHKFLDTLSKNLQKITTVLRNSQECEFISVTIPEALSILETERLLLALKQEGIPVRNIIVNRVQDEKQCVFCSTRRERQKNHLTEIDEKFASYNLVRVPMFPYEVRRKEALLKYAKILIGDEYEYEYSSNQLVEALVEAESSAPGVMSEILGKDLQFIIFGGKGGVGKTTVSAATALSIARHNPDKRILVFSTDPAHSLADSFACPIGDAITSINSEGNLYALEIDGTRLYEDFRKEYKVNIEDAFNKWQGSNIVGGRKWKLDFDRQIMVGFVDTYPPGLEEVLALEQIMGFVDRKKYDIYIFDTAPTGHLIELLKFPELVREWLRVTYRAILKYHRDVLPVDNVEIISKKILNSQTTVQKMREVLTDPQKSEFVAVTIPEAMSLLETEDLLSSIQDLGIPCSHVIINMVMPPTKCDFCSAKRGEQIRYIKEVVSKKEYAGCVVTKIPLFPHEIRGIDNLTKLSEIMYGKARINAKQFANIRHNSRLGVRKRG